MMAPSSPVIPCDRSTLESFSSPQVRQDPRRRPRWPAWGACPSGSHRRCGLGRQGQLPEENYEEA